jgi:hypothetical protein
MTWRGLNGRAATGAAATSAGYGGRLDFSHQLLAQVSHGIGAAGLRHHIHCSGFESIQGMLGSRLAQRTHDHHRQRMVLHEDLEKGDPIHPRHLNVERDHVGLQLEDFVPRNVGIHRGANHLDVGLCVQSVAG